MGRGRLPCIIKCDKCGLILANKESEKEAVTIWNNRVTPNDD